MFIPYIIAGIFVLLILSYLPGLGTLLILIAIGAILFGSGRSGDGDAPEAEADAAPLLTEDSPADRTAFFYRGTCTALTSPLYSYRDGYVFRGVNYGTELISPYEYTYDGGCVRDRADRIVGKYRDSYIWLGMSDAWISDAKARYQDGYIHKGTYIPELYIGDAIGHYSGDADGGAACAIAMLLSQQ